MNLLKTIIFALLVAGGVFLVMGHSFDDWEKDRLSDEMSVGEKVDDAHVTVWAPPAKKLEFLEASVGKWKSVSTAAIDETHIRPAWGMLVIAVTMFVHAWSCTLQGVLSFSLIRELF